MSDPNELSTISVTIKGDEPGGKFNDAKSPGTWIVFHGTPARVKEQICEVFDLAFEDNYKRPLFDLVNEATSLFKAAGNVSQGLGGSVLDTGATNTTNAQQGSSESPPWNTEKAEAKSDDKDPLLVAIENAQSRDDLQLLWAENQSAFGDEKYMAPWKARGKALK